MMVEGSVEACGIRVNQQLCRVETMIVLRLPWTFGAQGITHAGGNAADETVMHITQLMWQSEAILFNLTRLIKNAKMDA